VLSAVGILSVRAYVYLQALLIFFHHRLVNAVHLV